jgi:hypothetical protein
MSDNPLIKLEELTKPATVLVEKISDAVGGIFKPWQIVRVAKAEAAADQIHAESHIQISDLHQRAMRRFLVEEGKKQSNIEDITEKALPLLNEESKPQDMEDDWITNFFDKCRIVSDADMQQLWARVLADQANMPRAFSRRTVNLLSDLEKADAELFGNLCGFGWRYDGRPSFLFPFVFDVSDAIYNQRGIFFSTLSQLEALGLVKFDIYNGFTLRNQPKQIKLSYFESTVQLIFPSEGDNQLGLGQIILTQAGQELAHICAQKPIEGFLEYARKHWEERGLTPKVCEATEGSSRT